MWFTSRLGPEDLGWIYSVSADRTCPWGGKQYEPACHSSALIALRDDREEGVIILGGTISNLACVVWPLAVITSCSELYSLASMNHESLINNAVVRHGSYMSLMSEAEAHRFVLNTSGALEIMGMLRITTSSSRSMTQPWGSA